MVGGRKMLSLSCLLTLHHEDSLKECGHYWTSSTIASGLRLPQFGSPAVSISHNHEAGLEVYLTGDNFIPGIIKLYTNISRATIMNRSRSHFIKAKYRYNSPKRVSLRLKQSELLISLSAMLHKFNSGNMLQRDARYGRRNVPFSVSEYGIMPSAFQG